MRLVSYETENGFKHQSLITQNMPLADAHMGVPYDPPDVTRLDWDEIQKELNNLLIERNLITLKDIAHQRGILENTIKSVLVSRLIQLYRENPGYQKSPDGNSSNGKPEKIKEKV